MALDSQHPQYAEVAPLWEQMRDCYAGEKAIKEAGEKYLAPTPGQLTDGMGPAERGYSNYQAYKMRARFPNYLKRAVREMVGVMHNKPPVIELPEQMEPLRERATLDGESLHLLLRRINAEQLTVGRIGLMLDLLDDPKATVPYIATYMAENIINWDDGARGAPNLQTLNLIVLNETASQRTQDFFEWQEVVRYRVLILGEILANESDGIYRQGVFEKTTAVDMQAFITPSLRGRLPGFIPFTFINVSDLLPDPDLPPQLELADLALAIYRQSADYYLGLFAQSQDTLVIETNETEEELGTVRVGVGGRIRVPIGGDAKYIGVDSNGRPEQRQSLENDRREALALAGQLLSTTSRERESGEALKTRVASQTVTLKDVALTGGEGLQACLRQAAMWMGADPAKVVVRPNVSFAEAGMTASEFMNLQSARKDGLPMSDESAYDLLLKHFFTKRPFEEEMKLIALERAEDMKRQQQIFAMRQLAFPQERQDDDSSESR